MFRIFFLICSFCFLSTAFAQSLYFMPREKDEALDSLISTIKKSTHSLDIAIYSFTNREISKAIRSVAKKGVNVRIIYDKKSNQNVKNSTIGYLSKLKNVQTCLMQGKKSNNGKYYGLMHTKMAISDSDTLVIGSANWSKSAFETNYETLFITRNKELITKSKKEFDSMFQLCEKY